MDNLAIILVNYNGLEDTKTCIKSIMASVTDAEIIVIDNGSNDNEGSKIQKKFPDVTVIKNPENLGFAGANNVGITWAMEHDYDYILLLNNDTIIDKNMISILLSYADDKTVTVPAMYYESFPDELWYGGGKINLYTGNCQHLNLIQRQKVSFVTGCCMLLHREIINQVGLLDERYFMYCEDLDYSIKLAKKNIVIEYIPEAKLIHKVGKSTGGPDSSFSDYYITRNRLNCIKEHSDYFRWSAFPFSIISRYIRVMFRWLQGREYSAFLDAIRDHKQNIWGKSPHY